MTSGPDDAVVYGSTSGYRRTSPWAGHDTDHLEIGGFLAAGRPRGDGGPPIPGATVADAATACGCRPS